VKWLCIVCFSATVNAQVWLQPHPVRRVVLVNSPVELSDYPVEVAFDSSASIDAGVMQANCADVDLQPTTARFCGIG
jgi:hypothetical protein